MGEEKEITMEGFLEAFGVAEEGEPSAEPTEPSASTEPTEAPIEGEGSPQTAEGEGATTEPEPQVQEPNPADAAFAQMRIQNKQYKDVLDGVAKVLGVQDSGNPNAVVEQVNQLVLQAQAKQQQVPVELLQRLRTLEQRDQQYSQQQYQQQALLGFQKVKNEYNLEQKDLTDFANQLAKAGINPFMQNVDIMAQYKLMNYEKIMAQSVEKGIQQERERASKAGTHSTTPVKGTGGDGNTNPDKINTVSDLTAFFKSQN